MNLTGVTGAPYSHPRVQRKMPAPFERASISVGRHGKRWQQTPVADLAEGNIVSGFGRITEPELWIEYDPLRYRVRITNADGETRTYEVHDSVLAFR